MITGSLRIRSLGLFAASQVVVLASVQTHRPLHRRRHRHRRCRRPHHQCVVEGAQPRSAHAQNAGSIWLLLRSTMTGARRTVRQRALRMVAFGSSMRTPPSSVASYASPLAPDFRVAGGGGGGAPIILSVVVASALPSFVW